MKYNNELIDVLNELCCSLTDEKQIASLSYALDFIEGAREMELCDEE